jgi:hypothetical protein
VLTTRRQPETASFVIPEGLLVRARMLRKPTRPLTNQSSSLPQLSLGRHAEAAMPVIGDVQLTMVPIGAVTPNPLCASSSRRP